MSNAEQRKIATEILRDLAGLAEAGQLADRDVADLLLAMSAALGRVSHHTLRQRHFDPNQPWEGYPRVEARLALIRVAALAIAAALETEHWLSDPNPSAVSFAVTEPTSRGVPIKVDTRKKQNTEQAYD